MSVQKIKSFVSLKKIAFPGVLFFKFLKNLLLKKSITSYIQNLTAYKLMGIDNKNSNIATPLPTPKIIILFKKLIKTTQK